MKQLYIHHHTGIGDHICLKGAVSHIKETSEYEKINIFCKKQSLHLLNVLYNDDKRYCLIPIDPRNLEEEIEQVHLKLQEEAQQQEISFLRVGFNDYREVAGKSCDETFYEMMGIPYQYRFTKFNFIRDYNREEEIYAELELKKGEYIFIHDDADNGYPISVETDIKIIKNDISKNFFYFGKLFENAREIHCMESSIRCLLEFYDLNNVDLYCYPNLRGTLPGNKVTSRQNWNMVD
jgi:hypothetical protein